jgi:hypothetical protein
MPVKSTGFRHLQGRDVDRLVADGTVSRTPAVPPTGITLDILDSRLVPDISPVSERI